MSVISLYDFTGTAMRPWANAGHDCFCFDIQHSEVRPRMEHHGSGRNISPRVMHTRRRHACGLAAGL